MRLSLNDDQRAILDALDSLAKPYEAAPMHDAPLAAVSSALDAELVEAGFLDVGFDPDLGLVTAAMVVERLGRLPYATNAGMMAAMRPLLGIANTAPLCVVEAGRLHAPVRFLAEGSRVVVIGDTVRSFIATADHVRAEPEALYAYPMATITTLPDTLDSHDVEAETLRTHWRIALAAEAAGLLSAALASTVAHVTDRKQFGRPLATFQALRHRLAEAQVRTNGVYYLAMKAAATAEPADAALAAHHAQESARLCVYDFHQFLGAMGMTLEHPLHFWTYRLKALTSDLGGRKAQALAAADALWG